MLDKCLCLAGCRWSRAVVAIDKVDEQIQFKFAKNRDLGTGKNFSANAIALYKCAIKLAAVDLIPPTGGAAAFKQRTEYVVLPGYLLGLMRAVNKGRGHIKARCGGNL